MVVCEGGHRFGALHRGDAATARKGAVERFGGAISEAHCGAQQVAISEDAAAATVMRRRRMYSDNGMPASDENILRT